jgi:hypothetical protein
MTPKEKAHERIDALRNQPGKGVWTHLHRATVADQLDVRVDDPTKIYQGQVGLCAPSAFLEDLVTDDPVHYARMAHELFDLGFTHMLRGPVPRAGGKFLKPDEDLRTYPLPMDPLGADPVIPEADWLMLASIRQAYDFWGWEHFYKAKPDEGGTSTDDIVKFFKDTGYTDVINKTSKADWHSLSSAVFASDYVNRGYRVVLIINADLLVPLAGYSGKDELNHAVGLISPITGIPANVECTFFTWGTTLRVPLRIPAPPPLTLKSPPLNQFGNMTIETFLKYFFGFVAAKY